MAVLDEVPQHPRPPRPKKPKATATKTKTDGDDNAFKVAVRCRPLLPREKTAQPDSALTISGTSVAVTTNPDDEAMAGGRTPRAASPRRPRRGSQEETVKAYSFDRVYDASSTQEGLYSELVGPYAAKMHSGYNVTVFAYGQTGTGKTFTMEGVNEPPELRGIIPRAFHQIFDAIATRGGSDTEFLVRASYLEIYNEEIRDLLDPRKGKVLAVREDSEGGVSVVGAEEEIADGSNYDESPTCRVSFDIVQLHVNNEEVNKE